MGPQASLKSRIIAGFILAAVIIVIVASASAWQQRVHRSNLAELESHSTTASLLQDSEAEANSAGLLLQRYVISGDETYIPEVQASAAAAVESLTEATARDGAADVSDIAITGIGLAGRAGQVTALRQSGNIQGAAAAMEEIVPVFREFRLALQDATDLELQEVSALRSRADSESERDRAGHRMFLRRWRCKSRHDGGIAEPGQYLETAGHICLREQSLRRDDVDGLLNRRPRHRGSGRCLRHAGHCRRRPGCVRRLRGDRRGHPACTCW